MSILGILAILIVISGTYYVYKKKRRTALQESKNFERSSIESEDSIVSNENTLNETFF